MHELSIAQSIVNIVREQLPPGERRGVKSVKLKLGDLNGLSMDSLALSFEVATQGTPLEGAKLDIYRVPVICFCRNCGTDFGVGHYVTLCPNCQHPNVEILSGNELDVVEVELEDED